MKTNQFEELMKQARQAVPPPVSSDFAQRVVRSIQLADESRSVSLADAFERYFPRLALGAAAAILLSIAADFAARRFEPGNLDENVAQISTLWTLP